MIHLLKKSDCCGCEACRQRCPKGCIEMREDEEGFRYPVIDAKACIDCGLCEKVCPVIRQDEARTPLEVFAAKNEDERVRRESSSGGVFSLLSDRVIQEGGVVFGARWDENWQVVISDADTPEGVAAFRGSKYLQAQVGDSFSRAENYLKAGRKVLFSGTPCQIAGLRRYLKKEYPNLLTVDFICHGAPSPGVFREYMKEELEKFARKGDGKNSVLLLSNPFISEGDGLASKPEAWRLEAVSFRDKRKGWKKFSFALQFTKASAEGEKNTVSLSYILHEHAFMRGFLKNIYLRPSCYACPAKSLKSGADITLGDYWGIGVVMPDYDDDRGVSAVTVNTPRGQAALHALQGLDLRALPYSDLCVRNTSLVRSCAIPAEREAFYRPSLGMRLLGCLRPQIMTFHGRIDRLCRPTFRLRLRIALSRLVPQGVKQRLKRLMGRG